MNKFKSRLSRLFKPLAVALVVVIALTSVIPVGADNSSRNNLGASAPTRISVQVDRDPALLALYDAEALIDNPYFNAEAVASLYDDLAQATNQRAYFDNLPEDARQVLIADYLSAEYYVETLVSDEGPMRSGGLILPAAEVKFTCVSSLFHVLLYEYMGNVGWTTGGTSALTYVSWITNYQTGGGWNFVGQRYNGNMGFKLNNSMFWFQVGGEFSFLGFHDYVDIQITVFAQGSPNTPPASVTSTEPFWWGIFGFLF